MVSLQKTVLVGAAVNFDTAKIVGKEKTREILTKGRPGFEALLQGVYTLNYQANPKKSAQVAAVTATAEKKSPPKIRG